MGGGSNLTIIGRGDLKSLERWANYQAKIGWMGVVELELILMDIILISFYSVYNM